MNILTAYQNELSALLAILIVTFIYFKIKQQKSNKKTKNKKQKEEREETKQTLQKTEEKKEEITKEKTTTEEKEKKIIKKDLPQYTKITKEDFKKFSKERILLAEDNIINQKVILGLLAESGIEIIIANDGKEALDILEKDSNFTLILMDAHMPHIDGFEATRKIRENPRYDHIVIVALSGDTAVDDIRKMKEAGMSEHLEKPLKIDALYNILYAYSNKEKSKNQKTDYLELNILEGLKISGDDDDFYCEILNDFIKTYKDAYTTVNNAINEQQIEKADQLLLDIIGVSANIGAKNLTQRATDLKKSLQNNNNERSRLLFAFKESLENLLKEIKRKIS